MASGWPEKKMSLWEKTCAQMSAKRITTPSWAMTPVPGERNVSELGGERRRRAYLARSTS
jgi:hypothetical protein